MNTAAQINYQRVYALYVQMLHVKRLSPETRAIIEKRLQDAKESLNRAGS